MVRASPLYKARRRGVAPNQVSSDGEASLASHPAAEPHRREHEREEHVMRSRLKQVLFVTLLLLVAMPVALAKDGESKFATLNGAKIHYQSYGEGSDAFVLVHG